MSKLLSFFASMRFAISLLAVVGIASAIGTIIIQNQPHVNYLNQFGPFWFDVFQHLGYYNIYSSIPFLLILAFLVLSTSLCVWRQSPAIWRDFQQTRAQGQWRAMAAMPLSAPINPPENWDDSAIIKQQLSPIGGRIAIRQDPHGILYTIRHGRWQRLGYIFTHLAIIIICLGGLLDGQFPLRIKTFLGLYDVVPLSQSLPALPERSVLPPDNRTFRANVFIPEGGVRDHGVVLVDNGRLWQKLPFSVQLDQFKIDHYENGMPKNFESHLLISRNADTPANSEIPPEGIRAPLIVNHPIKVDGHTIYQASFDDGGSTVDLAGFNLTSPMSVPSLSATISDRITFSTEAERYTLELENFAAINVESNPVFTEATVESLQEKIQQAAGTAGRSIRDGKQRNFGPKLTYKLRRDTGEAVEVQTFMLPIELESGQWFWMSGVREASNEEFRYLRIPVYDGDALDRWIQIRQMLQDPVQRAAVVSNYLVATMPADQWNVLQESVNQATSEFMESGLTFVEQLMRPEGDNNGNLGEADRTKIAETLIDIIRGVLFEAWRQSRAATNDPPPSQNEASARYLQELLMSFHSATHYPVPLLFQLRSYEERQASVLQIARAPGQNMVYLGCLMLVIGIFLMIFLQDRRIMLWLSQNPMMPSTIAVTVRRGPKVNDQQFNALRQQVQSRLSNS